MFDKSLAERFQYLLDHFGKEIDDVVAGTGLSKSYLYYLKKGERENPTQEVLENIAGFFGISPLFFSRKQENWVPAVPASTIQYALRKAGDLGEAERKMLDELMNRAREIAERKPDTK